MTLSARTFCPAEQQRGQQNREPDPLCGVGKHEKNLCQVSTSGMTPAMAAGACNRLRGDNLHHGFAGLFDGAINFAVKHRALQHVDPRAGIRVHHIGKVEHPRHISRSQRRSGCLHFIIARKIFIVGQIGAGGQYAVFGQPFQSRLV